MCPGASFGIGFLCVCGEGWIGENRNACMSKWERSRSVGRVGFTCVNVCACMSDNSIGRQVHLTEGGKRPKWCQTGCLGSLWVSMTLCAWQKTWKTAGSGVGWGKDTGILKSRKGALPSPHPVWMWRLPSMAPPPEQWEYKPHSTACLDTTTQLLLDRDICWRELNVNRTAGDIR